MRLTRSILLAVALSVSGYGQTVNPGRVNVVTTPWSVNWLTHANATAALTDLGFSPYMQSSLTITDANHFRPYIGLTINVRDYPYLAKGNGTTNDRAAIQAAIEAAYAAGGGVVYLPVGIYKVIPVWDPNASNGHYGLGAIWLHNGVSLIGDGNDTIIRQGGGGNVIIPTRSDTGNHNGIEIARFQIDGNYTAYSESAGSTDANDNGLLIENANGLSVHDLYVHHVYGYGIFLRNGCHDAVVQNNRFEHCGNGVRSADAIYITARNSRILITHNWARYASRHGIMLNNEGPSSLGNLEDITITDNFATFNANFGISVQDNVNYCVSDDGLTRRILIAENDCNDNGTGSSFRGGIQVANLMHYVTGHYRTHLVDILITNNICGNTVHTSGVVGILLRAQSSGAVERVNVVNNICSNSQMGIEMVTNGDPNCTLDGCIVKDNRLTGNVIDLSHSGDTHTLFGWNYYETYLVYTLGDLSVTGMTVDPATGYVGFGGNMSPTKPIDVTGNVKASGKILTTGGLGVGNAVTDANTPAGAISKAVQVYDASGNALGWMVLYATKP